MAFRLLAIFWLMIPLLAIAQGRKPAVEDFVGIEIEEQEITPQGTEALFNLEQDIHKMDSRPKEVKVRDTSKLTEPSEWTFTTLAGASLLLGLPLILWFLMMSHLRRKAESESASNIEILENYRKQRANAQKSKDETKKAS
jgi:hypothetical protein